MAAVGFNVPTIDARSSPIFQTSAFELMAAGDYGLFGSFGGKMSAVLIKNKNRREQNACSGVYSGYGFPKVQ